MKRCYCCNGARFWRRAINLPWVCDRCHPPGCTVFEYTEADQPRSSGIKDIWGTLVADLENENRKKAKEKFGYRGWRKARKTQ